VKIQNVTVIGAGIMGSGITNVSALGGFNVVMQDTDSAILKNAMKLIEKNLQKGIERGKITEEEKASALSRITSASDIEAACQNADLVIEALPDNLAPKQDIFARIEKSCPDHTILGTNTYSMSITEIAANVSNPAKTVGMHFFNPVHIMKPVEIVCGLETSDETFKACKSACRQMGKKTVEFNELPGFVTNRMNAMIGIEVFTMLYEGLGGNTEGH